MRAGPCERCHPRATSAAPQDPLQSLRETLRRFAVARDWAQFHLPKNLAMALSVEAAELLEPFRWLPEAESAALAPVRCLRIGEQMADVLRYRICLADRLNVDLAAAARRKMRISARRYPVAKARGSSRNYTEL